MRVDGDADAVVTARICSGRFKFLSLVSFLIAKHVSLELCGQVYSACMGVKRGQ